MQDTTSPPTANNGRSGWTRATAKRPCPVCGKFDNCTRSRDGFMAFCGRISDRSLGTNKGGQFLHRLSERDGKETTPPWSPPSASAKRATFVESTKDWGGISKEAFDDPSAESARQNLAAQLGVSVEALVRLGVGSVPSPIPWTSQDDDARFGGPSLVTMLPSSRYWTWPERDATGRVIGISRRFPNGSKKRSAGGQSGLTFDPVGWLESSVDCNYVFLVEGGSDTAALLTMGLAVVGRPSNTGGVDLLADLLHAVPTDRVIVVLAENDRKSHESLSPVVKEWHKPKCDGCSACWPGRFGAITTATQLAERLQRSIALAFPPDEAKDARAWLNPQPTDIRIE